MGLIDDLKKWAHPYEDEDEEYEDDLGFDCDAKNEQ